MNASHRRIAVMSTNLTSKEYNNKIRGLPEIHKHAVEMRRSDKDKI